MSMQSGSYEIMIDSATRYFSGHAQVSDASYIDQPRFERTVLNAAALQAELETIEGLAVMPRVRAFAVVSMGEKSLGGMVMGVDFAAETRFLDIYDNVIEGQIPSASDEALIGSSMARNLGCEGWRRVDRAGFWQARRRRGGDLYHRGHCRNRSGGT
jgi:ABC-type lipoprotein release transport system permease subunit